MLQTKYNRFKSAPWFPKEPIHVLIGGAGGIGSWLALLLSRAGFKLFIYDFDTIDEFNLGGQFFSKGQVGQKKVTAIRENLIQMNEEVIDIFDEKITLDSMSHKYMIAAFDNMKARKDLFYVWFNNHGLDPTALYIDGRLEAEQMWIYCVQGADSTSINNYTELLEVDTDENIADAPCTMKQTSHSAAMIASHMTAFFTNHITNVLANNNSRNVPFKWEYIIPLDLLIY